MVVSMHLADYGALIVVAPLMAFLFARQWAQRKKSGKDAEDKRDPEA